MLRNKTPPVRKQKKFYTGFRCWHCKTTVKQIYLTVFKVIKYKSETVAENNQIIELSQMKVQKLKLNG